MQQDNKFSFINPNTNQITEYSDDFCKRLLTICEKSLNSYIKFLVPPQESCCEQLKQLLAHHKVAPFLNDTTLQLIGDEDLEAGLDDVAATTPLTSSPRALSPSKVCRFAENAEVAYTFPDNDEGKDELDSPVPTPFKFPKVSLASFKLESPKSSRSRLRTYSGSKVSFETPPVHSFRDQKSDVVFLPEAINLSMPADDEEYTPTTPIIEKLAPAPFARPKYTTQVSTLSTRSNTVSLYSCWPPPIGIIVISLLEVILFLLNEKKPTTTGRHTHGNIADVLMFDPHRRKEVWRFVTYLFVHIGYEHLLFNLAVQIFLGVILEMVHERWRVLTIYFAGIVAGSLGTSVFNPTVKLAGASGGVYALITAHIVTVILNWKHMQYPPTQLLGFLIVIITDLATGVHSAYHNKVEDISYVAHGCGALAGLLVGFPVLRKLSENKKKRWFQYVGLILLIALIAAAVIWNIAATSFFPKQEV